MPILVSGKFLWIKSHPISPHLSPHLVGLDSKDCLSVSPLLQSTSKDGCLKRSGIPGTICHMDVILIWGSTQEEHDQRLTEVCKRLKNSGMTLNAEKCIFSQTSIKFLGHIIDGQGIHPDPDKIAAIDNYQPPTNKKELKQ
ncbi:hypothetical protein AVEN_229448-1 [Araneus ventricosus]|uniref:Reverse transcriptase domain-containing protein n=1 Tax=Araneus ventricosus TaxID=182803 RepID=A0A4Y2JHM8_ARAVE|nr:hypothetical protein AVEN_229448-1 [Araneus ventricosus]